MMPSNFHLAPPPTMVDGLLAVPMDIQTVRASFLFDGNTLTAVADVTVGYTVGPTDGHPIFDLRQVITQAWLDGAVFPTAQLAAHDFGGGTMAELRILESWQSAGSVHELRVQYDLNTPLAQLGGSYPPAIEWFAGPKLRFSFGLSDLNAGRYAEAWLPANLLFDQYTINLALQITNTLAEHQVITNGELASLGFNHWSIQFPDRFTALSPLLEVRASDTVQFQSDTVALPISGKTVTVEAWKLTTGLVNLTTQIDHIKTFLTDNESRYGPYLHDNRFIAFFHVGGMEYEGGTTTSASALKHETFHSWYARGIKPASQADGWWDEAFTSWHDSGANDALPFDFSDPPVVLCSRNPWQRITPSNAYADGERFWKGVAALLGVSGVNTLMGDFYNAYKGQPVSTPMLEEFLLCQNGNAQIVDAFHRFVYGFQDTAASPELWLKDDPAHSGANAWDGPFWDSPDLWIRHQDDGGTTHQSPEYGQDNWFYARVRNTSRAGTCSHFVVSFHAKAFAGTQFRYPEDFLPCIAAKAEFALGPGEIRIVKARWPRVLVPPAGSHACLLASVIARSDHPTADKHVWEHNNLAQKNLTIVDLLPNTFIIIPVVIRHVFSKGRARYALEVWRDRAFADYDVSLVHTSKKLFGLCRDSKISRLGNELKGSMPRTHGHPLDCGGHIQACDCGQENSLLTSDHPDLIAQRFPDAVQVAVPPGNKAHIPVDLPLSSQHVIGFKLAVPSRAKNGTVMTTHFVQRHTKSKQITGGIAVQVRVNRHSALKL